MSQLNISINMYNISGQSVATVADSVTKNGKWNTVVGVGIIILGTIATVGGGYWLRSLYQNRVNNNKHKNSKDLEADKHVYRMAEIDKKTQQKKDLIDYRNKQSQKKSSFNTNVEASMPETVELETFNDIISGDEVSCEDQRLGLRCWHIGKDNGIIGRTSIGKTSLLIFYAFALASNDPKWTRMIYPEWKLSHKMKVLYFAFEQSRNDFKVKYGKTIKSIPNFFIDVRTRPDDFKTMQKKILKMQNEIGDHRLLVIFDNITKIKSVNSDDKKNFFQWLENYRVECENKCVPITYLKAYHTQGSYTDDMPLEATTIYGDKCDAYFTHNLVGFGMCKDGDGKQRYIKELKNKMEPDGEKRTVSIFKFADTEEPFYKYVYEAEECDILPTKANLIHGSKNTVEDNKSATDIPGKRGPKERFTYAQLKEIYEEYSVGFKWEEILAQRGLTLDHKKGIIKALKRHGIWNEVKK